MDRFGLGSAMNIRRCGFSVVAALLAWVAFCGNIHAGPLVGLVIGNNSYRSFPKLDKAVNDARSIRQELDARGFDVVYVENGDRRATLASIDRFVEKLDSNSTAVVFYAGHGMEIDGFNYVIPIDLPKPVGDQAAQIAEYSINQTVLISRISSKKPKFTLAVFDACRSILPRKRSMEGGRRGLAPPSGDASGVMIVYSAGSGQEALDGLSSPDPDPNGLFTREFLKAIRVPGKTVQEVINQTKISVFSQAQKVPHDQIPAVYDQSIGGSDFVFTPGKRGIGPEAEKLQNELEAAKAEMERLRQQAADAQTAQHTAEQARKDAERRKAAATDIPIKRAESTFEECANCAKDSTLDSTPQGVIYRELVTTGFGVDPGDAIVNGLELALSQINGQRLATSVTSEIRASTSSNGVAQLSDSFKRDIEKETRGIVRSYTILASGTDSGGRYFTKMRVVIPFYNRSAQLNRVKLAVAPALMDLGLDRNPEARDFANSVSTELEAYLTQTRKFAMLDRNFNSQTARELKRLIDPGVPIEESVRLGVRIGTDYLVILSLREFEYGSQSEQRVSGRVVERISAPVSLDIRVIDIATAQIKFATSYHHPGQLPRGKTLSEFALNVGADLGEMINFAIYPIAVVGISSDRSLILNQGGDTLEVGRQFELVSLGAEAFDPYTRESLGPIETEIGRVEIKGVTAKTSSARLISGRLPTGVPVTSLRLRPLSDDDDEEGQGDVAPAPKLPETRRESAPARPDVKKKFNFDDW